MASTLLKPNEEVQDNGVGRERYESDRDIDEGHRGGFDEWVVHRCFLMTQDQGTVSVQGGDLSHGTQSGKQNGTESGRSGEGKQKGERRDDEQVKHTTPGEEGCRRIRNPKEHGSDHDSLDHKRHNVGNLTSSATLEDLEPSDHDRLRLHGDRDDIGTLLAGGRGVFRSCALHVGRGTIGFADKLAEVSGHVLLVDLPDIRLVVMFCKLVRSPGHAVLVSFAGGTGIGVGYGDEEIRSGLAIGRLVAHVDEVLASERG